MTCRHGRAGVTGCEDCDLVAGVERGHDPAVAGTPAQREHSASDPVHVASEPHVERADVDLDLDLGAGRSVFVAAGDPIPAEHSDAPRRRRGDGKTVRRTRRAAPT